MLDELVKQALIGTSRAGNEVAASEGTLAEAIAAIPPRSPEARLLATAAVATAYQRAGRVATVVEVSLAQPAENETLALCSSRAAQILSLLLVPPASVASQHMIREWQSYATAAARRIPHRLLPRVLDYAAGHRAVRPLVARCIGARGAWLVKLQNRWRLEEAAEATSDGSGDWHTGTREQRRAILTRLRQTDPAGGLKQITSTWQEDSAEDREAFLDALAIGLSPADEPFLEAALDDKSKRVRAAAANLLASLPTSALVARMTTRAAALLAYEPASKKTKPRIEVGLPPEPLAPDWIRDGVTEKPAETLGLRQWWLLQVLSIVQPTIWSQRWNGTPADLVDAAARNKEFGQLLLRGWIEAAIHHPDLKWIAALVPLAGVRATALLARVEPSIQAEMLLGLLEARKDLADLYQLLTALDVPLDDRSGRVALGIVESHVSGNARGYDYTLGAVLDLLALRLPPELHDPLAAGWVGEAWEAQRTSLDRFFQTLSLRRDMKREFTL